MSRLLSGVMPYSLVLCVALAFIIPESQAATTVAVIDSGVDADHTELRGRLEPGFDLTAGDNPNDDRVGHGTAMASLIAGNQLGACTDCRILPVKVTDDMSVGLDQLAAAIEIAVEAGVSVIYVGAGATETNEGLTNAIESANVAGITVVAPAGTQGLAGPLYPSAYASVVAVAGLSRSGQLLKNSNDPGRDALYANGQFIRVAKAGGGYATVNGSSPAAARIAGLKARAIDQRIGKSDAFNSPVTFNLSARQPTGHFGKSPVATLQYGDTDDTDIILDAPWRTIREYLPFLVFVPEFEQLAIETRTIQRIELHNYDLDSATEKDLIFEDVPGGSDQTSCAGKSIEIVDAEGRARDTIGAQESLPEFWHYIAKIPVSCIGVGNKQGQDGLHFLLARVHWVTIRTESDGKKVIHTYNVHRVLRVLVGSDGFPRFSPADHYYDAHVHTIAEQTGWNGTINVDASRKAYGGPLAMLLESAYALGLVETQFRDGNWTAFRDQLATTDHNVFYSGNPYDAGSSPGYGPTANTDGKEGEFKWYREHFGELSGEEITLQGTGRAIHSDMTKAQGSHFLVYGGPHFEGPWHGGHFTADVGAELAGADITTLDDVAGVGNPNTMDSVLDRLSQTDAFGYAAHPFSGAAGWSKDYFDKTIGLPPYFNDGGPNSRILQSDSRDFIFKGSQVWNEKHDYKSTAEMLGGHLAVTDLDHFDPFTSSDSKQRFVSNPNWAKGLNGGIAEYVTFLKRGLKYSFSQQPDHRFIRKLYMSAGTDAHGDFNYLTSLESTAVAEIYDYVKASVESAAASSNAFGRVRTYTLTGEKMGNVPKPSKTGSAVSTRRAFESKVSVAALEGQVAVDDTRPRGTTSSSALRASVMAYREGNTILTDGPICKFSVDSECHFDSDKENPQWHDGSCSWENADGRIGGEGDFDGGGSVLISRGSSSILNTIWDGRNDYIPLVDGQPDNIQFVFSAHGASGPSSVMLMDGGPRGETQYVALPDDMAQKITERRDYAPAALMLRADLGSAERQAICITNPVWTIPTKFYYPSPPAECSIRPGELRVSVSFGVSMDSTTVSERCTGGDCLAPVGGAARAYQGATIKIYPLDGSGNSVGNGIPLKTRWFDNNLSGPGFKKIADANLVGDNVVEIACPSADWDANSHSGADNTRSYAVVVSDLRDMHGNELNAIADTFTLKKGRSQTPAPSNGTPFDPKIPGRPKTQSCNAASTSMCGGYGATCEVTTAVNGSKSDLCRWSSHNTAAACNDRTAGIWTTSASRYAKNHPGAVPSGVGGACITDVKNLENRIQ